MPPSPRLDDELIGKKKNAVDPQASQTTWSTQNLHGSYGEPILFMVHKEKERSSEESVNLL